MLHQMTVPAHQVVDLTQLLIAIIGGIFSILSIILTAWLQVHIHDNKMRQLLYNALKNSLGVIQQASVDDISRAKLELSLPTNIAVGVRYVILHASEAMKYYGLTPKYVADKINALIGLQNIETNKAIAASSSPIIPDPMGKVPTTTTLHTEVPPVHGAL